jgi:uncharacterized membrane protein
VITDDFTKTKTTTEKCLRCGAEQPVKTSVRADASEAFLEAEHRELVRIFQGMSRAGELSCCRFPMEAP